MRKLKRAVWCLIFSAQNVIPQCGRPKKSRILPRDNSIVLWILLVSESLRKKGLLVIGSDEKKQLADWFLKTLCKTNKDLETILTILIGDEFVEKNKKDVARLQREAGRKITSLWDTDPIFSKYPHLRGLARNKEFEKMWAEMKQKQK